MNKKLMQEKIVIVTGANRGLGFEMTRQLAAMGATVIMACRSTELAEKAKLELQAENSEARLDVMALDLVYQQSIKQFSEAFIKQYGKLDVLINNAGVQTPEKQLTPQGVELTFAINVLGPQILTQKLLPVLKKSAAARIVNIASDFAGGLDLDDINFDRRKYNATISYKQSKQANRMLTREWTRRLENDKMIVNSMTPDLVPATDLFRHQPGIVKLLLRFIALFAGASVTQGADTAVWLASASEMNKETGGFYRKRRKMSCRFEDPQAEKRLWDWCESKMLNH